MPANHRPRGSEFSRKRRAPPQWMNAPSSGRPTARSGVVEGEDVRSHAGGRARLSGTAVPAQHLAKPGRERDLELAPMYEAPATRIGQASGYGGAHYRWDFGIGRAVAVLFAREGADVAIAYLDEDEDAEETKRAVEHGRAAVAFRCPATSPTRSSASLRCRQRSRNLESSIFSLTTRHFRNMWQGSRICPTNILTARSRPTSMAISHGKGCGCGNEEWRLDHHDGLGHWVARQQGPD